MDILSSLTAPQQEAVQHVDGPLLVLAGPGSGKTRVVTHRIAYLVEQGVWPSQIVALTFTNKAADEMRRRIEQMVPGQRIWISTFHRFCSRLLREFASLVGLEPNFSIYDTEASLQVVKRALEASEVEGKFMTAERVARAISSAKADLISAEQLARQAADPFAEQIATLYPIYQQMLLQSNAVDFDDLLVHVAVLLQENESLRAALDARYRYVLVDEYQDTNAAQYAIVRGLSIDHPNLAVTGDPDQSIYGWRGANIHNILHFEQDYPQTRVVRLEENFRSSQRIVQAASHLIAFNRKRKPKALFTSNDLGGQVRLIKYPSWSEEADDIAAQIAVEIKDRGRRPADFAVFFRTNALSRSLEHSLRRFGVPYQIVRGVEFYQRREIKDLLAYLYLLNNPRDDEAFRRTINTPPRGIGRQTVNRLEHYAREARLSLLDAAGQPELHAQLGARAAAAVRGFAALYSRLAELVGAPVEEILGTILSDTQFYEYLKEAQDAADVDRAANVAELLNEAREFDAAHPEGPWLEPFLERAALVSDTDQWDAEASKVSLMTLHASKGLEFPVVFIVGVEEGLIPHERSRQDTDGLEEERRLLFVGITRAQYLLQLSHADRRMRGGSIGYTVTSSFLSQLPVTDMELIGYGRMSPRGRTATPATDDPWAEDSYDQRTPHTEEDVPEIPASSTAPVSSPREPRPAASGGFALKTAAELLGPRASDESLRSAPVERFTQGMLVQHPTYGIGRILALSGLGEKRTATIRFFQDPEEDRKFRLAFSPVTPASESGE